MNPQPSNRRDPILVVLISGLLMFAGAFGLVACTATNAGQSGTIQTTTTTVPAMTFEQCQESGKYDGGQYAVEYDHGVCTVQRPAATTSTTRKPLASTSTTQKPTVENVSYANCAAVRAAGKAPLHASDPGYSPTLDRDHDGTACDS